MTKKLLFSTIVRRIKLKYTVQYMVTIPSLCCISHAPPFKGASWFWGRMVLCIMSWSAPMLIFFDATQNPKGIVVQSRALQWMLDREAVVADLDDPCWKGLVSSGGLPCWVCTATGGFALDPPARLQDCRGGLFCDEPVRTPPPAINGTYNNLSSVHDSHDCTFTFTDVPAEARYLYKVCPNLALSASMH